jgi:hypothetical protein
VKVDKLSATKYSVLKTVVDENVGRDDERKVRMKNEAKKKGILT